MCADLVVRNGKVVTRTGIIEADIAVDYGKISTISKLPLSGDKTIDAKGNLVLPGFIDPHVHLGLRFPIESDCRTETPAAAHGGVTTVMSYVMPRTSMKDEIDNVIQAASRNTCIDIAFQSAVSTVEQISEIESVMNKGASSFKFFLSRPDLEERYGIKQPDDGVIYRAFTELSKWGGLPKAHCENFEISKQLIPALKEAGRNDLAAWNEARPDFCEEEGMQRIALIAKATNMPVYIVHLSIGAGLDIANSARAQGVRIYLETCPHYLTIDKDDTSVGIKGKINPPLRSKDNIEKLWTGIANGSIHCIGTDHIPTKLENKVGDLWSTQAAFPGVQTFLPIMLTEGVVRRGVPIERIVEVCCYNNAKINMIPNKGSIEVGYDGDLVIVDLDHRVKMSTEVLKGASDFSLYDGKELVWPITTILRGQVLLEEGELITKPNTGRVLKCMRRQNSR